MNEELVSIIMSTRDTEDEYLMASVHSILEQTHKNLELILIIDGGRYNECLLKIKDKRLRIIKHNKSLGLATRLNEGINLSKGKFVARMDSDDYALPDRIEKQYAFMRYHPEVDICSMFSKNFGDSKKVGMSVCITDDYIQSELFLNCILIHPTVMFRRLSIEKFSIKYNETFRCAQDYELWSRLAGKCFFATIPEIGIFYRKHNKQITADKKGEQEQYRDLTIKNNLKKLGFDEQYIQKINMLRGKISKNNINDAIQFIDECIYKNSVVQIYDKRVFKNVLYRHLFTVLLKNNHYLFCLRVLRLYDVFFVFRSVFLIGKCNFQIFKYRNIYKKLMCDGF